MRRLLQGRRNFKSTTRGTVWRAGSTAQDRRRRGLKWGRATGRLTVLNRTPESFKTDVAPQWPGDSSSFARSGRRVADLLQAWDRFVRSVFSSFARHNRTSEMGDVAPQRLDETALLFAKAGLRRSIDLLQAWHRFVVATFSNLSQRTSEMLKAAAAP